MDGRRSNCATSKKEEVGLDRPHSTEASEYHHAECSLMESPGELRGNEGALETAGGEIWSVR